MLKFRKGVFMRCLKIIIFISLSMIILAIIPVKQTTAADIIFSDEGQRCLECHSKSGIMKKFENGESIEAFVNAGKFKESVHGSLNCSACHSDFSADDHPQRRYRSKEQYKIKSSLACRQCHTPEKIKAKSFHDKLLNEEYEGKPHPCTNCHTAHTVTAISKKTYKSEEQYCMKCHTQNLSMEFKDGETQTLKIDASLLLTSVHRSLNCSDCHFGFSNANHPRRDFKSKRAFFIANSEVCRRCHYDKYAKAMESIHYTVLSQGNLNAPVCTDCHGSHLILPSGKEKSYITQRCQKCHTEIYATYAKSVHGKALFDEHNQDVPICIDCHMAHNIKNPLTLDYREMIPDMCGNCHANKDIVSKYGLSTDVVKTYLSDFHGITLSFYKKQREEFNKPSRLIAVCTDCHGTHNIISTRNIAPAVVKANLVKRCRQCHKEANKNFPDAWLSHYTPAPDHASMIYIINLIYNIFTPIMIAGIILQILLHIWRYAVNR
jgi:hypothetical protein